MGAVRYMWWRPRRNEILRWLLGTLAVAVAIVVAWITLAPSEETCGDNPLSCGAGVNLATTVLVAAAVGVFWFRLRTRWQVTRRYLADLRERPDVLLATAPSGDELHKMAPRTPLYRRVADEVRQLPARNIQAIEGDAGSGKTVALLGLARYLAGRGCVPVVVSLREATMPLDFTALAREQFLRAVDHKLASDSDGDRLWRLLCRNRMLVILADGLDEVLASEALLDTDEMLSFRSGKREQIPVVVASRPRTLPEKWRGSTFDIGVLEDEHVKSYLKRVAGDAHTPRAALARRLEAGRTPLYLAVIDRLADRAPPVDDLPEDVDDARRVVLQAFVEYLIEDGLGSGTDLERDDRQEAVEAAGRLAYALLLEEVDAIPVDELDQRPELLPSTLRADREPLVRIVARAIELGVLRIGTVGGKPVARFRHPILQAHLAARVMGSLPDRDRLPSWAVLADQAKTEEAFLALQSFAGLKRDATLGREISERLLEKAAQRRKALRVPLAMCAAEVARAAGVREVVRTVCEAAEAGWDSAPTSAKLLSIGALSKMAVLEKDKRPSERVIHRMLWRLAEEQQYVVEWRMIEALAQSGVDGYEALAPEIDTRLDEFRREVESGGVDRDDPTMKALAKFLPRMTEEVSKGMPGEASSARESLDVLCTIVGQLEGRRLGVESSLAQGFKEAAKHDNRADVDHLITRLAQHATFWFTRLNALHALTRRQVLHAADPKRSPGEVEATLKDRVTNDPHPYVSRAAALCVKALHAKREDIDRYIWDDESAVVASASDRLHPDAHRLIGEMVLLLNMNEQLFPKDGTRAPGDTVRRDATQRAVGEGDSLPGCLQVEAMRHAWLLPEPPVRQSMCPTACGFRLCPYRPELAPLNSAYREISPDFCRHERSIAGKVRPVRARRRRKFWAAIEERSAAAARLRR